MSGLAASLLSGRDYFWVKKYNKKIAEYEAFV